MLVPKLVDQMPKSLFQNYAKYISEHAIQPKTNIALTCYTHKISSTRLITPLTLFKSLTSRPEFFGISGFLEWTYEKLECELRYTCSMVGILAWEVDWDAMILVWALVGDVLYRGGGLCCIGVVGGGW